MWPPFGAMTYTEPRYTQPRVNMGKGGDAEASRENPQPHTCIDLEPTHSFPIL